MTPERAELAMYLVKVRGMMQHEAAAIIGVNQGRVSEVITGKRFGGTEPPGQLPLDF
jgi:predicted XRE-type DNA-binding protein